MENVISKNGNETLANFNAELNEQYNNELKRLKGLHGIGEKIDGFSVGKSRGRFMVLIYTQHEKPIIRCNGKTFKDDTLKDFFLEKIFWIGSQENILAKSHRNTLSDCRSNPHILKRIDIDLTCSYYDINGEGKTLKLAFGKIISEISTKIKENNNPTKSKKIKQHTADNIVDNFNNDKNKDIA